MALGEKNNRSHFYDEGADIDLPSRGEEYEGKYDPADFIVPASDTKGHSERVWCRMQPGHDRQLEVILGTKKFPFRSKGDIIRWAVVRGIKILEQMEEMPSVTSQVDAIVEFMRDEEFQASFASVFEVASQRVNAALINGPRGMNHAKHLASKFRHQISKMPSGYWKNEYLERFEREFGHLLEAKPRSKSTQ